MAGVPNPSNAALDALARSAPAAAGQGRGTCRGCGSGALKPVVDLGRQPPAERFVRFATGSPPSLELGERLTFLHCIF